MAMEMAPAACEIARLPKDLLSAVIALTAPRDAFCAAAVSRDFRAAADSDAVWSAFLPRDLPPLADGELSRAPPSKKGLFFRLSDRPVFLPDSITGMWLDKETGAKCYLLTPRAMKIAWINTPHYWILAPFIDSRFSEAFIAELWGTVCWLELGGKIQSMILSQKTRYAVYMVFKLADEFEGMDYPLKEASVTVGEIKSTREVRFCGNDKDEDPELQKRADGWMELEMGEFYNDQGDDGEVCINLMETKGYRKSGLIVYGIEIRPKKVRS